MDRRRHLVFYFIHGTCASRASWMRPGSAMRKALQREFAGQDITFKEFRWPGILGFNNGSIWRNKAARILEKEISDQPPNAQIFLVGHSHGGNIAMAAARHPRVRVATIGTPFFLVGRKKSGALDKALDIWMKSVPLQIGLAALWMPTFPGQIGLSLLATAALFVVKQHTTINRKRSLNLIKSRIRKIPRPPLVIWSMQDEINQSAAWARQAAKGVSRVLGYEPMAGMGMALGLALLPILGAAAAMKSPAPLLLLPLASLLLAAFFGINHLLLRRPLSMGLAWPWDQAVVKVTISPAPNFPCDCRHVESSNSFFRHNHLPHQPQVIQEVIQWARREVDSAG